MTLPAGPPPRRVWLGAALLSALFLRQLPAFVACKGQAPLRALLWAGSGRCSSLVERHQAWPNREVGQWRLSPADVQREVALLRTKCAEGSISVLEEQWRLQGGRIQGLLQLQGRWRLQVQGTAREGAWKLRFGLERDTELLADPELSVHSDGRAVYRAWVRSGRDTDKVDRICRLSATHKPQELLEELVYVHNGRLQSLSSRPAGWGAWRRRPLTTTYLDDQLWILRDKDGQASVLWRLGTSKSRLREFFPDKNLEGAAVAGVPPSGEASSSSFQERVHDWERYLAQQHSAHRKEEETDEPVDGEEEEVIEPKATVVQVQKLAETIDALRAGLEGQSAETDNDREEQQLLLRKVAKLEKELKTTTEESNMCEARKHAMQELCRQRLKEESRRGVDFAARAGQFTELSEEVDALQVALTQQCSLISKADERVASLKAEAAQLVQDGRSIPWQGRKALNAAKAEVRSATREAQQAARKERKAEEALKRKLQGAEAARKRQRRAVEADDREKAGMKELLLQQKDELQRRLQDASEASGRERLLREELKGKRARLQELQQRDAQGQEAAGEVERQLRQVAGEVRKALAVARRLRGKKVMPWM